jgi:hypothetical protein
MSRDAGPIVATIFVRRMPGRYRAAGRKPAASIGVVPRPTRPLPRTGGRARIHHFGGTSEPARIVAVHDGGRRLEVRSQGGEVLSFELNPATARFLPAGDAQGMRLELLPDAQGT